MADNGNGWKAWLIGALFTIMLGFSAVIYANMKEEIASARNDANDAKDGIQALNLRMERFESRQEEIKASIKRIDDNVGYLLAITDKNTARYRETLDRYQRTLDALKR